MLASLAFSCLVAASAATPTSAFVRKSRPYDALHYRIEIRLEEKGVFHAKSALRLKPTRALSEVELDAFGLTVQSVSVAGRPATFALKEEPAFRTGTLKIKAAVPAGKETVVEVAYSGKANSAHEGLFEVREAERSDNLPYYFTHFQPTSAQQFFPCNDTPDDKATTEIFAIVDGRYQVFSNGKRVLDEAFSEAGRNLRRVHWKQEKPHSPYLVALAIGPFETVDVGGDTPAALHIPSGKADRAFIAQDITRHALRTEAEFLGVPYPWDKYDQVAVPQFIWGGMENTSLVMMREEGLVLAHPNHIAGRMRIIGLVTHELAHQWFGNFVTCSFWDDTWLNEGFATYLSEIAQDAYLENDLTEVDRADGLWSDYFKEEDGPRAHALVGKGAPTPADMFDGISYVKGAQVLRMLELWLGRDELRKGLKAYLEKHALKNATSDDFFLAVAKATKKESDAGLRGFRESWLKKKGYPVLTPTVSFNAGTATLTVTQKPNHADEKGPFVFKLPIVLHRESEPAYTKEITLVVDKLTTTLKVAVPAAPEWVNWNRDAGALARIESSAIGEQAWIHAARKDPDPVWRLQAQLVLLGEWVNPKAKAPGTLTESALDAVMDVLKTDPSPYVRAAVLGRLGNSKWKTLPGELGPVLLELAKRPSGLPEDPLGRVSVRRAALQTLGKVEFDPGHRYLIEQVLKPDIDLNDLSALAVGVARIGNSEALSSLRAAILTQKNRGYPYYRHAAYALGAVENPEVVSAIRDLYKDIPGNNELGREILRTLGNNTTVRHSPEAASFIQEFVLENREFGAEFKSRMLKMLDDVKTPEVQQVLSAISKKSDSARLRASAQQVLDANFKSSAVKRKP